MCHFKKTSIENIRDNKRANIKLSKALEPYDLKLSKKLKECANFYSQEFYLKKQYVNMENSVSSKKRINHTCKSRFCKICEKQNNNLFYKGLTKKIEEYDKEKYGVVFITLTMKNPKLKDLSEALTKLTKVRNDWIKKYNRIMYNENNISAGGYFASREITYTNKDGSLKEEKGIQYCHPHDHILMLVPKEILLSKTFPIEELQLQFQKLCKKNGISQGHIDVRYIKKAEDSLKELIKYSTKDSDYINFPHLVPEIAKQLKGKRMYSSSGLLKTSGKQVKDSLKEELEELENDFRKENELILSLKRIWSMKKNYYVAYGFKWEDIPNDKKKQFLHEVYKLGHFHDEEICYMLAEQKINLSEKELELYEFTFDSITMRENVKEILNYTEEEKIKIQEVELDKENVRRKLNNYKKHHIEDNNFEDKIKILEARLIFESKTRLTPIELAKKKKEYYDKRILEAKKIQEEYRNRIINDI
jgi:hypothetical protein